MDIDFSRFSTDKSIVVIIISGLWQFITLILSGYIWNKIVFIFSDKKIPYSKSFPVFAKSNMLKYIPGNIFQYVGRNKLAIDNNISHVDVACATILDTILGISFMTLISAYVLGEDIANLLRQYGKSFLVLIALGIAVIILIAILVYKFRGKLSAYLSRYKKIITERKKYLLLPLSYYILSPCITLIVNFIVAYLLFPNTLSTNMLFSIAGAYGISWVIGFITPGAPGGIGIRESVMLLITGAMLEESILIYVLIFRFSGVIADFIGFIIGLCVELILKQKRNNKYEER